MNKYPNPKRQMIGRRSRIAGQHFESLIALSCNYYRSKDIAVIEKTPEPMKPLRPYGDRKRGQYIACFTKQAQPDYKGVLCDGTGIIFEAKHTDTDRIRQNVITEKQWESLNIYEKLGAHCYVMVSLGLTKFYRIPWNIWKRMEEIFGHKFMTEKELEEFKLKQRQSVILILEGVELRDEDTKNGTCTETE